MIGYDDLSDNDRVEEDKINPKMQTVAENTLKIDYVPSYENGRKERVQLQHDIKAVPSRAPDYIEEASNSYTKEGKNETIYHWWFEEMVGKKFQIQNPRYNGGAVETEETLSVVALCPVTGHLMHTYEGIDYSWEYCSKSAQDAFVNWVSERAFFTEGE